MNDSIWKVQQAQDSDYLESILKFLLPEFGRIFGEKTMFNEECIIFNLNYSRHRLVIAPTQGKY